MTSDFVDQIMAYEDGELNDDEIVTLFQQLIESGLVSQLQEHYGRTANRLIAGGHCRSRSSLFSQN